jgi:choline-sulfatase
VAKWHPYDESVKVPMLVWWPGRVRQGVVDAEHLVSGVDVMSTVCDYAGVPQPPQARGLSLRPLLEGAGEVPWRDHVYAEMQHTGRMIRTERYKFVTFYRFSGDPDRPFVRRDDGRSAVFEQGHGQEYEELEVKLLFDMQDDPWETRNLWEEPGYGELIARHRELLDEWEAQLVPGVHYDRN